jgi:hypothetical protein
MKYLIILFLFLFCERPTGSGGGSCGRPRQSDEQAGTTFTCFTRVQVSTNADAAMWKQMTQLVKELDKKQVSLLLSLLLNLLLSLHALLVQKYQYWRRRAMRQPTHADVC